MFHFHSSANGVQDDAFHGLDDAWVLHILEDQPQPTVLSFISKFNYTKGLAVKGQVEQMEVDVTEKIVDNNQIMFNEFALQEINELEEGTAIFIVFW